MAFSDPQSITVNSVAQTLPRVSAGPLASTYQKSDNAFRLTISRLVGKRRRYMVRIDARKVAPDPLASANNLEFTCAAYMVIDAPQLGYSNTELADIALALSGWATAANLQKVVGNEN